MSNCKSVKQNFTGFSNSCGLISTHPYLNQAYLNISLYLGEDNWLWISDCNFITLFRICRLRLIFKLIIKSEIFLANTKWHNRIYSAVGCLRLPYLKKFCKENVQFSKTRLKPSVPHTTTVSGLNTGGLGVAVSRYSYIANMLILQIWWVCASVWSWCVQSLILKSPLGGFLVGRAGICLEVDSR